MFRLINIPKSVSIVKFSAAVSMAAILFSIPFFTFIIRHAILSEFSFILMTAGLALGLIAANFIITYLLCFTLRSVGRGIVAVSFILNAAAVYYIRTYGIFIDQEMMQCVFKTNFDEASGFITWGLIGWTVIFGLIPCVLILLTRIKRGDIHQLFRISGISLAVIAVACCTCISNFRWVTSYSDELIALLQPWSYSINSVRHFSTESIGAVPEILLPNATVTDDEKAVFVLVIGESSRRANFSLYGYGKNTNPRLSSIQGIHLYWARSKATFTIPAVKAILSHKDTSGLYEILPNYLYRNGADVIWRTTNGGEPPVHIKDYLTKEDLRKMCDTEDRDYDGVLLAGLGEQIKSCRKNKILVVLHTYTSHGPEYHKQYPPRFEKFTPIYTSVDEAKNDIPGLVNAYDNTILYTDYILGSIIDTLKSLGDSYHSAMLYISDHGESLGEDNHFSHGTPLFLAPKEQIEIPAILWLSDEYRKPRRTGKVQQRNVFHIALSYLGFQSPVYNPKRSVFE